MVADMGAPEIPDKVKLVAAVTFQDAGQRAAAEEFLTNHFGPVDLRSEIIPFSFTGYYADEMGADLLKVYVSFEQLIKRDRLPSIKLLTNQYEQSAAHEGRRTVNIDPGYIGEASLILATTKNFSHRIYLGEGIFGDCHLIFEGDAFKPLPWTYADYREPAVLDFFKLVRTQYFRQMREEKTAPVQPAATYRDAGVDIGEGERAVARIREMVQRTYGGNVLSELGKFGGFYTPDWHEFEEPVLVSSVDGVGTKLKIAFATGVHTTVGRCLVNHCVNDILCCGAKPLFFLDYLAFDKLDSALFEDIVSGLAGACEDAGCALIGGETAEMPGFYNEGEYDISGTIVGIADRRKILDGTKISAGDVLLGLPSNGLHTNGYSLARTIFFDAAGYTVDSRPPELGCTVGEELLKIHRCYFNDVFPLVQRELVTGLAHITGGGLPGNIGRLPLPGLRADIDWESWERLPVFNELQRLGNIPEAEMRRVFNLGIGMVIIAPEENAGIILESFRETGARVQRIGTIVKE